MGSIKFNSRVKGLSISADSNGEIKYHWDPDVSISLNNRAKKEIEDKVVYGLLGNGLMQNLRDSNEREAVPCPPTQGGRYFTIKEALQYKGKL